MVTPGVVSFERAGDATLVIHFAGVWSLKEGLPSIADVERQIASPPSRIAFHTQGLTAWDSSILTFLTKVAELCRKRGISLDREGLPSGIRRLLDLAEAVPERKGAQKEVIEAPLLERIGTTSIGTANSAAEMLAFLGEMTITFGKLLRMKAHYRASDLFLLIQECGAQALPIVTLISFLVGVILAFVGAVQLKQFGAQLYIADLVGIAMMRDMGAMMTAIIMAGRTGAAFAAQLGTMKVTQEIDAFVTMGVSPLEFLVLPRVVALILMMPLLCLYSDFVGVLGGAAVGTSMLEFSWTTYFQETSQAVALKDVLGGVFKSGVYGALVALSGCLRGLQSGKSSSAVGDAATSAVVTGIVAIIVACGVFSFVFYVLGI
ncbi:MAG TPA: ABC transporter permease [Candidatus Binatia bacterium]|jgi:phospholipid/cholesterol/gamma-HCH transport system permease protein|nr:ABC transporter permease [Candidatus Binatia bacterium]